MADDDKQTQQATEEAKDSAKDAQKAEEKAQEAAGSAQDSAKQAEKAEEKAEVASDEARQAAQKTIAVAKEEAKEEKKPDVKVSAKLSKLIEEIEKLSVLELSELVKALEVKFGVTAAAPMAMATAAGSPAGTSDEGASEQTTFNVILADGGANKISVIKAVREIVPTLGLKEAKDLVDGAPKPVVEGVNKENAQEAKTKLEAAGAKVELK